MEPDGENVEWLRSLAPALKMRCPRSEKMDLKWNCEEISDMDGRMPWQGIKETAQLNR